MPKYPKLNLRSKNELYKQLTGKNVHKQGKLNKTKELFCYCLDHFDALWADNSKESEPEKDKWVRTCKRTKLGKAIKQIDAALLKPYDHFLPDYIHGGVTGTWAKKSGYTLSKCTQSAALSLIDGKKGRWLLKLDLKRFFEQISQQSVVNLFNEKFNCDLGVSWVIANLCCVDPGKKQALSHSKNRILGRGFATSGRLAVWCSMEFYADLEKLIKSELSGHNPLFAVFVDDIGITATNINKEKLEALAQKIVDLATKHNLIVHPVDSEKTEIIEPCKVKEYLGLRLARQKIFPSTKTTAKRVKKINDYKQAEPTEKRKMRKSVRGLINNKKYTQKVSNG